MFKYFSKEERLQRKVRQAVKMAWTNTDRMHYLIGKLKRKHSVETLLECIEKL